MEGLIIVHYYTLYTPANRESFQRRQCRLSNTWVAAGFTPGHRVHQIEVGNANLLLVFFVKTFVMACLIVTPAFSISFFDKPVVMHTLSAGCSFHSSSLPLLLGATGMLLSRVIRTPLASVCMCSQRGST